MIVHDVVQSSADWWRLRLGMPTASNLDKILTSATLKPSKQSDAYLDKLLAEWLMQAPIDDYVSAAMDRGTDLEPEAWRAYEFHRDADVTRGGFITTDDGAVGCSPDGRIYVGEVLVGGVELKCPGPATHVGYLRRPATLESAYRHQVQGCMYVCDVRWWDVMSYHPIMPPVIVRVARDETYMAALGPAIDAFCIDMELAKAAMVERGVMPRLQEES